MRTPVEGAEFALYGEEQVDATATPIAPKDGETPLLTVTSGADGKLALGARYPGTYYLFETEAPEDYVALNAPVEITVEEGSVSVSYSELSISGTSFTWTARSYSWAADPTATPAIPDGPQTILLESDDFHFTNYPKYGELKIVKILPTYITNESATFTYTVTAKIGSTTVYSNVASITLSGTSTGTAHALLGTIPIGSEVTVVEVNPGSHYRCSTPDATQTAVITADAPAEVSFTNSYSGVMNGGHGIENHFEGDAATGWTWTAKN